jgi:tRNA (guanine37-N1)-methyltransferase
MVFKIEPIVHAISSILKSPKSKIKNPKIDNSKTLVILFSAAGKQFTQKMAANWARKYNRAIMIAGHYEGVDERVKRVVSDLGFRILDLSVGPYVLTGGELPAMVVIDAISRHIPGVLGKAESLEEKRGGIGVPVYTRPKIFVWRGRQYRVPKILLSGNHAAIEKWRKSRTKKL